MAARDLARAVRQAGVLRVYVMGGGFQVRKRGRGALWRGVGGCGGVWVGVGEGRKLLKRGQVEEGGAGKEALGRGMGDKGEGAGKGGGL